MPHLTQKERMLLQDQLNHEQICITKYSGYAARTRDPEIRRMFNEFAADEQQHYDTINNLLQGRGGSASQSFSRTGNVGQAGGQSGRTAGSQTGSYQATPGGSEQNWMSETRTVYGGQITQGTQAGGLQGGQQTQGAQSRGVQGGQGTQGGLGSMSFEAGSELYMSTSDDKSMLEDMLMTEKYISGAYDTAVFESSNQEVRQALQHIQRDEQKHGERIFQYMQQKGMYQPQ